METERCGKLTKQGRPCQWSRLSCPWHNAEESPPPGRALRAEEPEDLRELARWVIRQVVSHGMEAPKAQAVNAAVRILVLLGQPPEEARQAGRHTILRGRVMHGLPPGTSDEWLLAEGIYDPPALAELRRWEALEDQGAEAAGQ